MVEEVLSFPPGAVLFKQGSRADKAYFVISGKVEIAVEANAQRRVLNVVSNNSVVGEMALIDPAPRMATAVAVEPTQCRVITPDIFKKLISASPPLSLHLLRSLIRSARLRVGLPASLVEEGGTHIRSSQSTTRILDRRVFTAGQAVFREGQKSDGLYVIQEGEVEIRRREGGAEQILRQFVIGEVFGERGVFERVDRAAGAYTTAPTICEFVNVETFNNLITETSPFLVGLMRIYVKAY